MTRPVAASTVLALRGRMADLRRRLASLEAAKAETDAILTAERRAVSNALAELQSEIDEKDGLG